MKLSYKMAKAIKAIAYNIDEAVLCDGCISYNRIGGSTSTTVEDLLDRRRKAIKKIGKLAQEVKCHYNMSNQKFNKVIFELVCSQFVNSEVFSNGEDYDEETDGPFHPVFENNWHYTLDGYQAHFMPTSEMIGMEF